MQVLAEDIVLSASSLSDRIRVGTTTTTWAYALCLWSLRVPVLVCGESSDRLDERSELAFTGVHEPLFHVNPCQRGGPLSGQSERCQPPQELDIKRSA